jgi:ParB-like chromosome segregation protein Spo0J
MPSQAINKQNNSRAARLAAETEFGLERVNDLLSTEPNAGTFEDVPIDSIRIDIDNPRLEGVKRPTYDELRSAAASDVSDETFALIEYIRGLAASIRSDELHQPLLVYRYGEGYALVDGECRYWACRLVGKDYISAKVLREPPENIKRQQFVLNTLRRDLPLRQRLSNLRAAVEIDAAHGHTIDSAAVLMDRYGFNQASAYRWYALLNAPADVAATIKKGNLSGLKAAYNLASIKDNAERQQALASLDSPATDTVASKPRSSSSTSKAPRGRPRQRVKLGSTKQTAVLRYLVECAGQLEEYAEVDWEDIDSAQQAWTRFFENLTQKLR